PNPKPWSTANPNVSRSASPWDASADPRTWPPQYVSSSPTPPATSPCTSCTWTAAPPSAEPLPTNTPPHGRALHLPDTERPPMSQRTATPAATAGELLTAYRPGDSFFSTASGALHGTGALTTLDRLDALPEALAHVGNGAVAMGAAPFDADRPAHLVIPKTLRRSPSPTRAPKSEHRWNALAGRWGFTSVPEPAEHVATVERTVELMAKDAELRKVVLARCLQGESTEDIDVATVLSNLLWRDPTAFVFAVDLPRHGTGTRTLIGASPELLVAKRGRHVLSNPLAGSAPRSADPTKDQRHAVGLLTSTKDRHEHARVVEAVAEALSPYSHDLSVPDEPELIKTATLRPDAP